MTNEERIKCNAIIHLAAGSAAGVAAVSAQIPYADHVLLVPIEITMVISLGKVFGIDITGSAAKGVLAGKLGTIGGMALSQALCGWIPLAGNIINAAAASGMVEALGWAIANDFSVSARHAA